MRSSAMFRNKRDSTRSDRWYSEFVSRNAKGWASAVPLWAELEHANNLPVVLAIGSGKGGVGKSLISANFAADLALRGKRTLVVDLDIGCANIHTYFGTPHPAVTLDDFLSNPDANFLQTILTGPIKGLAYVAGGRQDERNAAKRMTHENLNRLWHGIVACHQTYDIDFVILDLGAGTHSFTLELFTLAHIGIVTVLPEPTSIENAYVFMKSYLLQLITNIGAHLGMMNEADALCDILSGMASHHLDQGYAAALRKHFNQYPQLIQALGGAVVSRKLGILVNQAREREDRDIGKSMEDICRRFFGFQTVDLGYLNYDESAWRSLRNQRLLVSDFPHSLIVQRLNQATHRLLSMAK